jgi:hypothetical protein
MARTSNGMVMNDSRFYVVHPLDDVAEEKRSGEDLGPIEMTRSVKVSLLALRGYLIVMAVLVLYHVLGAAKLV